ncbi:MAG: HAMP domain-containing protein [Candidatus Binatia bacterium]
MTTGMEEDRLENLNFPRKIGRRLTLALGFLIVVVLLVGGFSLYLAKSITESTDKIKGTAKKIEHTDRIHFTMHHLIEQINRTIMSGMVRDADKIPRIIRELEDELRHYMEAEAPLGKGGPEYLTLRAIQEDLALLIPLAEQVTASIARGIQPSQGDLAGIRSLDDQMRRRFSRLNRLENKNMDRVLTVSRKRMNLIAGIYLAFLVVGTLGLVVWSWAVSKTIVSPIRNLASAALEVARGDFNKRVPVTSKDEIGQLSHSFNFMAETIRDHEEKLKGVAALQERERIAQELHDSLAQDVGLLHLKIAEAEQDLRVGDASSLKVTLKEMRKITGRAFDDVRQAIFGLRTMVSKSLGFIPTLTEYLHDFSEQRGVAVDLKVDGDGVPGFSAQAEIQVIRIIHEALTNVFKHAEATRSEVRFEREGEFSKITIEDDGKGFQLGEVMDKGLHFGLKTMRERARTVNGELKVETAPGKGTKVVIYLPFEEKAYGKDPGRPS